MREEGQESIVVSTVESLRVQSYRFKSWLWSWANYLIPMSFLFITVKWDNYRIKLCRILLIRIKRAKICEVFSRMPDSTVIVL